MKKQKLILGLCLVLITLGVFFGINSVLNKTSAPPLLVENFVDLNQVQKISKFRSCQGHTVVPVDHSESRRNMKHYFVIRPEYRGQNSAALYAPYDGHISLFSSPEEGLEGEVWIDNGSEWQFSIQHIQLLDSIKEGDRVKAGQLLGYVPEHGFFDVVYAVGASEPKIIDGWNSPYAALNSFFYYTQEDVLKEFHKYGINSPEEIVYSKKYRDENPCAYRDNQGGLNDIDHPEDWVFLQ